MKKLFITQLELVKLKKGVGFNAYEIEDESTLDSEDIVIIVQEGDYKENRLHYNVFDVFNQKPIQILGEAR